LNSPINKVPKVSIIVTTYNCAPYIACAINSILSQTFRDFEIVIVDDESSDETVKIIDEIATVDNRINLHRIPHGGLPSITRNAGLSIAQGKYVCFLDGDDYYEPHRIEKQLMLLDNHDDLIAVFHDVKLIDAHGCPLNGTYLSNANFLSVAQEFLELIDRNEYRLSSNFYKFMTLKYAAMHTSSVMILRSFLESKKLRFSQDIAIGEDTELWWKISLGGGIAYIDEPLSFYRQHSSSITRNLDQYWSDLITVHERNYQQACVYLTSAELKQYRNKIAEHYATFAYTKFRNQDFLEARKLYASARKWNYGNSAKYIFPYIKTFIPNCVRLLLGRRG
jgi:glycosyltransferase involved in cell wall biosynthesis